MQKNNAFCSICTVNYTAYAGVLNESLRKAGHKEPHYVLVVDYDEKYKEVIEKFGFKPVFLSELAIPKIDELIEKYSAFELSNVLKPFFMEWLLKEHKEIEKLVYLDTDIFVYSPMDEIFEYLDKNSNISVVITPHVSDYKAHNDISDYKIEKLILLAGLYNGGFYVVKNDKKTLQFLNWHKNKLFNFGYNGASAQMFVDQKILDFAPIFFEYVGIYKNKSYNVAHWNYKDHPIECKNNIYFVGNKRLVFFHFSQLKIDKKNIAESSLFGLSLRGKPALQKIVSDYWAYLERSDHEEILGILYGFKDRYKQPSISLVNPLLAKTIELEDVFSKLALTKKDLEVTEATLDSTKTALDSTKNQLDSTKNQLDSTKTALDSTKNQLDSTKNQLDSTKNQLDSSSAELQKVYTSREWRVASTLRKLIKIVFSNGSLRRKTAVGSWRLIRTLWRLAKKAEKDTSKYLKLKKKRKINLKPKKKHNRKKYFNK